MTYAQEKEWGKAAERSFNSTIKTYSDTPYGIKNKQRNTKIG